jgi:hypothetical protein
MEQTKIAQQMTSFYKTTYDSSVSAMNTLQEQAEKMVNLSLDQSPWLPEQSKDLVNTWTKAYRKGCDDFKAAAEAQYKKFEAMSNPGEKVNPMETVDKRKSI